MVLWANRVASVTSFQFLSFNQGTEGADKVKGNMMKTFETFFFLVVGGNKNTWEVFLEFCKSQQE